MWEYRTATEKGSIDPAGILNAMSEEGWDLVTAFFAGDGNVRLIFRRQKPDSFQVNG